MKIGIDARMYRSSVAGIGRYSQNLIKNLLEIDHKDEFILFMTSKDREEFENYFIENLLKIENYKLKIVVVDIPHFSLTEQIKLPKILEKENLDLMHFLNFNYPVKYKRKFIVTIHDLTLLFYPGTAQKTNPLKQSIFKHVLKKACQNAEKIIAVSKNTKKDIIETFGLNPEKISVIYEAADDRIFKNVSSKAIESLKKKYQIKSPLLLYVGQFRYHKNIEGLIRAYRILKKDTSCQLAILGKSNLDNQEIFSDIIRPGFVSDEELACWYKMASVFVFPSFYEGFGLPGLEAMSAGLPVVASNKGSLPEIYQKAAIYFDPFNPTDIADKIKMVLEDKKLRERLVEYGKIVAAKYSWAKCARETLKVYKEVLYTNLSTNQH